MAFRRVPSIACLALPAFALLASPTLAQAQSTPLVLDGTIADGTPRYFAIPFTVPDGVQEIEVTHDDLSTTNILDWGLRDPQRFRGWGGGNTEPAVVSVTAASRSYLPGVLPAGQWSVLVGQARVEELPARYHVEITFRTTPTLTPQPERAPYVPAAALSTGPRWYAGDFHVHTRESGDAIPTLDAAADFAHGRGLDFIELSDHNTVSQLDFLHDVQPRHPDLLLLPGEEVTTYWGHANAIGATGWVDFRVNSTPEVTIGTVVDAVRAQGALLSINHPMLNLGDQCLGCAWMLPEPMDAVAAIELQNGGYTEAGGAIFFPQVTRFWEAFLAQGLHVTPLGGSDDHRGGDDHAQFSSPEATPTTMVYARELSVAAILEGVAAGHTVVRFEGPDDPMVELTSGGSIVGDTLHVRHATLTATVTHGTGSTIAFVHDGVLQPSVPVTSDPFTTTLDIDAPAGLADDRWRCQLSVNGSPRVVTSHLWIAATGDPLPTDAGTTGTDAGGLDGGTGAHHDGGCGCRTRPARGTDGAAIALIGLGMTTGLARRRRRATHGER